MLPPVTVGGLNLKLGGGFSEEGPWSSSGRGGEARLGLDQFRNDHVQKVELQAPLLLYGSGKRGCDRDVNRSQLLLVKAVLGLERVRSEVNISALPRPLLFNRGVYVIGGGVEDERDGSSGGGGGGKGGDGFHVCHPLPDAWLEIGRRDSFAPASGARNRAGSWERHLETMVVVAIATATATAGSGIGPRVDLRLPPAVTSRQVREGQQQRQLQRQQQQLNEDQRLQQQQGEQQPRPQRQVAARSPRHRRSTTVTDNDNDNGVISRPTWLQAPPLKTAAQTSARISAPTPTDRRGWQVQCSVFGHQFRADRPMGAPVPKPIVPKAENAAEDGLPLGGVEAHAYLQCGVERLRGLFGGDGDGGGGVLTVELLHRGETGDDDVVCESGDDRDLVRCYCEVPLETLVDSRIVEGTFPLLDRRITVPAGDRDGKNSEGGGDDVCGSREHLQRRDEKRTMRRRMSSYLGGLFDPSLELAVHLYRMGPLNSYNSSPGGNKSSLLAGGNNAAVAGESTTTYGVREEGGGGGGREERGSDEGSGGGVADPPAGPILWKPPSLVERGKVGRRSPVVTLYERPQMEVRSEQQ
ncbi:unnamed protein product [Ectocarpus sp. CCAP 1310/34]|nr:unnamed protein product [Ectocarpus sp. CCAP 1310/34]